VLCIVEFIPIEQTDWAYSEKRRSFISMWSVGANPTHSTFSDQAGSSLSWQKELVRQWPETPRIVGTGSLEPRR
jgi:hypothetical protein